MNTKTQIQEAASPQSNQKDCDSIKSFLNAKEVLLFKIKTYKVAIEQLQLLYDNLPEKLPPQANELLYSLFHTL